jgi:hypothetical protein
VQYIFLSFFDYESMTNEMVINLAEGKPMSPDFIGSCLRFLTRSYRGSIELGVLES